MKYWVLLKRGYRYHKIRKAFSKFYHRLSELIVKHNIGLKTILQQGISEIVSVIRKYHNHKPQTNPWHPEDEPHNNHETPGRQKKQSNQLSLPHQDISYISEPIFYDDLVYKFKRIVGKPNFNDQFKKIIKRWI